LQSLVARVLTRDISYCTQVPDFKLRLEILRGDGIGLGEVDE
jgi:hypothetical protein